LQVAVSIPAALARVIASRLPDFRLAFWKRRREIARSFMEQDVVELSLYERLWAWFETNKKQAMWGAVALAVISFIIAFYIWRQGENEVSAAEAFTQAMEGASADGKRIESPEAFLKVAAEHPGTSAAGRALLQAATLLFESGKYTEAQAQFERYSRENPDSPFLPQSMLGVAASLDAQGKTNDAARAYENLANRYPGANVAPQAQFALARIYEAQGKLEQAWTLYEKLVQTSGLNSSIGSEAGIRAEELRAKMPATPTTLPLGAESPVIAPAISAAGTTNLPTLKTN
jgi:predicted negative regulator of RcsB-dependent stress response